MRSYDKLSRNDLKDLYVSHHGWLQRWLQRKLGCFQRAEDLAQDVFLRLLRRNEKVAKIREPRAFLSSIARGLLVDHWRRKELEQTWLNVLAQFPPSPADSPEDHLQRMEELVAIDGMLRGIKKRARKAFLLARLEGLTCRQTAARLGVSPATVERDLAKALRACYRFRYEDTPLEHELP